MLSTTISAALALIESNPAMPTLSGHNFTFAFYNNTSELPTVYQNGATHQYGTSPPTYLSTFTGLNVTQRNYVTDSLQNKFYFSNINFTAGSVGSASVTYGAVTTPGSDFAGWAGTTNTTIPGDVWFTDEGLQASFFPKP